MARTTRKLETLADVRAAQAAEQPVDHEAAAVLLATLLVSVRQLGMRWTVAIWSVLGLEAERQALKLKPLEAGKSVTFAHIRDALGLNTGDWAGSSRDTISKAWNAHRWVTVTYGPDGVPEQLPHHDDWLAEVASESGQARKLSAENAGHYVAWRGQVIENRKPRARGAAGAGVSRSVVTAAAVKAAVESADKLAGAELETRVIPSLNLTWHDFRLTPRAELEQLAAAVAAQLARLDRDGAGASIAVSDLAGMTRAEQLAMLERIGAAAEPEAPKRGRSRKAASS